MYFSGQDNWRSFTRARKSGRTTRRLGKIIDRVRKQLALTMMTGQWMFH